MQPLMRIIDVAAYLGTTPGAAKNWIKKNNVPVIDLGRGRALGLRVKLAHVEDAVNAALIGKKQPAAQIKTAKLKPSLIRGRSREEVLAELTDTGVMQ